MPLKTGIIEEIQDEMAANPQFAADVEEAYAAMELRQELAKLREQQGLSQRQLAARLGVTQPAIVKLETGNTNFGIRTFMRAVHALGGRVEVRIIGPQSHRSRGGHRSPASVSRVLGETPRRAAIRRAAAKKR